MLDSDAQEGVLLRKRRRCFDWGWRGSRLRLPEASRTSRRCKQRPSKFLAGAFSFEEAKAGAFAYH